MRMVGRLSLTVALVCAAGAANAQQPKKPSPTAAIEARLAEVAADVEELKKLAVEFPSLQKAVADLSAEVQALRQDVDRLAREASSEGDVVARLDRLEARLGELAAELSAVRSSVQAQTAPEAAPVAGGSGGRYDEGFVLVESKPFTLRMRGYAQLRYYAIADETLDDVEEASFLMRRARLAWDGMLHTPRLKYKIQLDFGQGRAELLDYYAEGELPGHVFLRAGQYKVPFSRLFLNSAEMLSFVDRSSATDEFRYDRDLGVMATWKEPRKRLDASVGVFNGAGRNRKNDNIDPLLVMRVQGGVLGEIWNPEEGDPDHSAKPRLVVGAGVSFENAPVPGTYDDGDVVGVVDVTDVDADEFRDNVRVIQAEADVSFRWKGVGVEAEGYLRSEEWGVIGESQTMPFTPDERHMGGVVQASYFVLPGRFQVGVRFARNEFSGLTVAGRSRPSVLLFGDDQLVAHELNELSVLAAYYRHRHGIELSAMYTYFDFVDANLAVGEDRHRFIVEAQVGF